MKYLDYIKNLPELSTGNDTIDLVIYIVFILLLCWLISGILRLFLNRFIKKSTSQLNIDPTQFVFLKNGLNFLVYVTGFIVIFYSIPNLKQFGVTLFASAGILAAIIGFASQAAFSNIVSGLFIVVFKPFRVGDTVMISKAYFGNVEDVTLRHTVIRDIENKRFIIPNSVISTEVIHNFIIGDEKVSNQILFGVSYETNIDKAFEIIREEAMKHRFFLDNRSPEDIAEGKPPVIMRVMEWAESSIQLRATVWTRTPGEGFDLKCDLLKSVKERFDSEGIEIPYPHRIVNFKNADGPIFK